MVPIRYLLEVFGISGENIAFNKGTITITAGAKTIVLKNGSDTIQVDGKAVKLGTAVVIKDGRTFVPMGQIAKLLGIQVEWDNETKTATFKN